MSRNFVSTVISTKKIPDGTPNAHYYIRVFIKSCWFGPYDDRRSPLHGPYDGLWVVSCLVGDVVS